MRETFNSAEMTETNELIDLKTKVRETEIQSVIKSAIDQKLISSQAAKNSLLGQDNSNTVLKLLL